jgi:TonB-dependent receptor
MINGERIPAPESDTRAVALDVIPSDQLAAIEVSKTLLPDQDADAIGGAINLITKTPRQGQVVFNAFGAGGVNQITSGGIANLGATWGQRFGTDQKLGFLVGGTYYRTERGSNNIEQAWCFDNPDDCEGATGVDVLESFEMRDYVLTRERLGFNGTLDYQFTPTSTIWLRGMYNRFSDDEFRRISSQDRADGTFTPTSPTTGTLTDFTLQRALRDRFEVQEIYTAQFGGRHLLGRIGLDYQTAYAAAGEDQPDARISTFEQGGVNGTYNLADPNRPAYTIDDGREFDYDAFEFTEYEVSSSETRDRDWSARANLTVPFRLSTSDAVLKFGGMSRLKRKRNTNDTRIFEFDDTQALSPLLGTFANDDFFFRTYDIGRFQDPARMNQFTTDNASLLVLDENATREESDPATFTADEDVFGGYVMSLLDFGRLRLIPGVRVEATRVDYTGNEVDFDVDGNFAGTTPVTGTNRYTNVFPGLTARYAVQPDLIVRGAFTTSLARPNYFDLVPYRIVNREDDEVSLGNPELKPTYSVNGDLSVERYFSSLGLVSAGVFYKRLRNYIFTRRFDVTEGTFAGFEATQPQNGNAATLYGLEVAWQQRLTFLPGFLSGFGINANYTLAESDAEFPDRESDGAALPGQSRHIGNLGLFFDRGGFSARLGLNYQGRYIDEVGTAPEEDRYYDSRTQLDIAASVRVGPQLQLFAEAVNLTNAPLRYYIRQQDRPDQQEYYRAWGLVGVRYALY